jgi:hypothetical protein
MNIDHTYLDKAVHVKLITGETLPDGIRYWGNSAICEDVLWFGIPKPDEVHKSEVEFHVPKSSIAYILVEESDN